MLLKSLVSVLLMVALQGAAGASVITVLWHGTVDGTGIDHSGMFGRAGADLAGQDFTAMVRYSRPPLRDPYDPDKDGYRGSEHGFTTVDFAMTINERTQVRQFIPTDMFHFAGDSGERQWDYITMRTRTPTNVRGGVYFTALIFNYTNSFVGPHPRLERAVAYDVVPGDLTGGQVWMRPAGRSFGNLEFMAKYRRVEVSSDAVDVPEPPVLALMLAALAAAGVLSRRRR